MSTASATAERFAQALDAEDYDAAETLLCEQCAYTCRGEVLVGPPDIVESYRNAGDSARSDFDTVDYESHVQAISQNLARIEFVDHLSRGSRRFTFRCRQIVEVDDRGRIVRIEHVDLPGMREALSEFLATITAEG